MKQPTKPTSNQDAFDQVYRSLVYDRVPRSVNIERRDDHWSETCMYRTTHNGEPVACAIGRLIPDDLIKGVSGYLLSTGVAPLLCACGAIKEWLENVSIETLIRLQQCHDLPGFGNKDKECNDQVLAGRMEMLHKLANEYQLTIPNELPKTE